MASPRPAHWERRVTQVLIVDGHPWVARGLSLIQTGILAARFSLSHVLAQEGEDAADDGAANAAAEDAVCLASGGSTPCEVADYQIEKIVEAVELGPKWEEEVLSIVSTRDEAESIMETLQKVQERLRTLGKVYLEGVLDDGEYDRQKRVSELCQEVSGLQLNIVVAPRPRTAR